MAKKSSLREKRRLAREEHRRKQRTYAVIAVAAGVVFIGILVLISWNRQRLESASATATAVAQAATNTVIAATQALQTTAAAAIQATGDALAASVQPMVFSGVPTDTVKTDSGLQYLDLEMGSGPEAKTGDTVLVHYTGWLTDGKQFDSSVGKQPFAVNLGAGGVIPGWEEGLVGMKAGGRRILVIPPDLGYGESGQGDIPPNATLVFEIVLLQIQ